MKEHFRFSTEESLLGLSFLFPAASGLEISTLAASGLEADPRRIKIRGGGEVMRALARRVRLCDSIYCASVALI